MSECIPKGRVEKEIRQYDESGYETNTEIIRIYDKNNNLIYRKDGSSDGCWYKYDENNNLIYSEGTFGEEWYEYDENNKEIYKKKSNGDEKWYEWYKGNKIKISKKEFEENKKIKDRKKLFLNNKKYNRFEIMDI